MLGWRMLMTGDYQVDLKVDRSSLYVAARDHDGKIAGKEWSDGEAPPRHSAACAAISGDVGMFLREGQLSEVNRRNGSSHGPRI